MTERPRQPGEPVLPDDDDLDDGGDGGEHQSDPTSATVELDGAPQFTAVSAPAARRRSVAAPSAAVQVHSEATQQLPATRGLPPSTPEDTRQSATAATPLEALRAEEVVRTRIFLKICVGIVLASLVAVAIAGGDPYGQLVVTLGCLTVVSAAGWLLWVTRDPAKFTPERVMTAAVTIIAGAFGGVYYWGVASPACGLILYGVYFFSFSNSARATLVVYVACAVVHGTLATLVITGAIADRGIVKTTWMPLREQIVSQLVVEFLYGIAFVTARASRKTLVDALDRLEKAVRAVSQREALLSEARAELDRALRVGGPGRYSEQVVGSYRLGMLIGRGGMGEVYEGTSVHDGGVAAVKLLHPSTLADPQSVRRFLRETEAAARLECPHVVEVLEVGTTSGEIPFLAMERLRGFDLAHHLRRKRRLSLDEVVELVRQVGRGLQVAAAAGIVHRDIKPHNLFLAERDGALTWKILDFGVSKVGRSGTLTRGHVVGTPGYMAPEQARGDDVDPRADVYALGAIVYRCLTGHPPFSGKDVPSTLYDVCYKMPTRPSALAELPDDLDRVLALALAKQADDRFDDGAALADALAAAAAGRLDVALQARADALLARHGWGQRQ